MAFGCRLTQPGLWRGAKPSEAKAVKANGMNKMLMILRKRSHGCYPLWDQWLTSILGPISGKYGWKPQKFTNKAGK